MTNSKVSPEQEIKGKEYANEYQLHKAVVEWVDLQYPHILYRSDYGGVKLSIGTARKMKALNRLRGYPDLFIIEPNEYYRGLFIEIKTKETNIYKKDGKTFSTPHIKEQFEYLQKLRERKFVANFGVGFDNIKNLINEYLSNF